jgi:hypothetical protein
VPTQPSLDFGAGYVQRAVDLLPRQGDRPPWRTSLNYYRDAKLLRHMPVEDPELHFSRSAARTTTSSSA